MTKFLSQCLQWCSLHCRMPFLAPTARKKSSTAACLFSLLFHRHRIRSISRLAWSGIEPVSVGSYERTRTVASVDWDRLSTIQIAVKLKQNTLLSQWENACRLLCHIHDKMQTSLCRVGVDSSIKFDDTGQTSWERKRSKTENKCVLSLDSCCRWCELREQEDARNAQFV